MGLALSLLTNTIRALVTGSVTSPQEGAPEEEIINEASSTSGLSPRTVGHKVWILRTVAWSVVFPGKLIFIVQVQEEGGGGDEEERGGGVNEKQPQLC